MPPYNKSPFAALPQKLIPGQPAYLFGSWKQDVAPTKMTVTNVALAANVATLTVQVFEGNIPIVGALITVQGTASTAGLFNVTNVALTGVTINATTGAGTVTFALTHANVTSAADGGVAIVPQPEVGEAIAAVASVAVGLPYATPYTTESGLEAVQFEVSFPTLPTAVTITPQGAMTNQDSAFVAIGPAIATVATSTLTLGTLQLQGKWNFIRVLVSGLTGSGLYVVKVGI